jgi:hypothetical protein
MNMLMKVAKTTTTTGQITHRRVGGIVAASSRPAISKSLELDNRAEEQQKRFNSRAVKQSPAAQSPPGDGESGVLDFGEPTRYFAQPEATSPYRRLSWHSRDLVNLRLALSCLRHEPTVVREHSKDEI